MIVYSRRYSRRKLVRESRYWCLCRFAVSYKHTIKKIIISCSFAREREINLQQRFYSSKTIYSVTSPKLIFLAKLYSAGRRRHGNAVSVNFIKCVRRVRDTVNSAAAYIEFSCLNGNLSYHITRRAFFMLRHGS